MVATAAPALADDAADIRHLMMATFDRPDAPLTVAPVTVSGDVAIAGWAQDERGGRALLRRTDGTWTIALCSGDALKEAGSLTHFGLAAPEAEAMAAKVRESEATLDPALVAKFSTFDGVMMIGEDGHHPPADGNEGHAGHAKHGG